MKNPSQLAMLAKKKIFVKYIACELNVNLDFLENLVGLEITRNLS